MNRVELIERMNKTHDDRMKLMGGKSDDYASQEDTLSNFKRMFVLCETLGVNPGRSPFDCAIFLLLLKIDRLCNLRRKGAKPKNESVKDTILDAHNYLDLSEALMSEETQI